MRPVARTDHIIGKAFKANAVDLVIKDRLPFAEFRRILDALEAEWYRELESRGLTKGEGEFEIVLGHDAFVDLDQIHIWLAAPIIRPEKEDR
jgi:hypothetical protein